MQEHGGARAEGAPLRDPRTESGRLAEQAEEMAVQLELVKLAEEELPLGVAYKRFLDLVHRALPFEHGTLYVTEWGNGRLVPVALRGNRIDLADQVRFARGSGLSAWVAQEARPVIIPDPEGAMERSPFTDEGLRAFLAFPLVQHAMVAGVLALARCERTFSTHEFGRLGRLSEALGGSLVRLRRAARLRELVYQDPQTGISNRHHFLTRVEEEAQRSRQHASDFSVALIEIDGLAAVEASMGSPAVSRLVSTFTQRLQTSMRSCDTGAAVSERQWGLLLAGVSGERAAAVIERISADVLRGNLDVPAGIARLRLRVGLAGGAEAGYSARSLLDEATTDLARH